MAVHTTGAAGPSCLHACQWKRLCTSFRKYSSTLCNALAVFTCRIATEIVDSKSMNSFVACVCETVRRIVRKAILTVMKPDVLAATGAAQLCAGQEPGCEVAVHAMNSVSANKDTEAVLLVDASNSGKEPELESLTEKYYCNFSGNFPILTNTYQSPPQLFVGSEVLLSQKGTTL